VSKGKTTGDIEELRDRSKVNPTMKKKKIPRDMGERKPHSGVKEEKTQNKIIVRRLGSPIVWGPAQITRFFTLSAKKNEKHLRKRQKRLPIYWGYLTEGEHSPGGKGAVKGEINKKESSEEFYPN